MEIGFQLTAMGMQNPRYMDIVLWTFATDKALMSGPVNITSDILGCQEADVYESANLWLAMCLRIIAADLETKAVMGEGMSMVDLKARLRERQRSLC